jgi:hypothetical protein
MRIATWGSTLCLLAVPLWGCGDNPPAPIASETPLRVTTADIQMTASRFGAAMVSNDLPAALDVIAKKSELPGGREGLLKELERVVTTLGKASDFDVLEAQQVRGTRRLFYVRMITYHPQAAVLWDFDFYDAAEGARLTGFKYGTDTKFRDLWK